MYKRLVVASIGAILITVVIGVLVYIFWIWLANMLGEIADT
jgi:hypothetical protein